MSSESFTEREAEAVISRRIWNELDSYHRRGDPDVGTAQIGRETKDAGLVFTQARVVDLWPLFPFGQTVLTTNAERHLEAAGFNPSAEYRRLLLRHLGGDWGVCYREDLVSNDLALMNGSRIFSVYEIADETYWLITEAKVPSGNRSVTTLLLPEDY